MATILIVEDETFMSDIQKEAFSRAHIECETASNGLEALKRMEDKIFDLIILDIVMPKMDGFELLKKIGESSELKNIPIVVLTNLGQESDKIQCSKLGACQYLLKTQTSLDDLVEKVRERLAL